MEETFSGNAQSILQFFLALVHHSGEELVGIDLGTAMITWTIKKYII